MVFELPIISLNDLIEFSPISKPIQPSGIESLFAIEILASLLNASAIIESIGKAKFTPFAFAFSISCNAKGNLSSSTKELPIEPPNAFANVYAIPPPIIIEFTVSNNFSINKILSETFAPPIIAVNGRSAWFITFSAFFNSLAIT